MTFHYVFLLAGLFTIAGTLVSLRRQHIRSEYSVSWLAVGAVLTGFALFPGIFDRTAGSLGLDPQVCFLIVGGALISALLFEISHVVSRLRDENVMLAQRVAILEFRIQQADDPNGIKSA
jgi:hypothetical protein